MRTGNRNAETSGAVVIDLAQRLDAKRNGQGWVARCPAHDDKKPSLSIAEGRDGRALIKCHAGCSIDEVLAAAGLTKKDLFPESTRRQSGNGATSKPAATFDWQKCNRAFTDKHIEHIAQWRGYSREFCQWLRDNKLVGIHDGAIAFPVHRGGKVVAAHVHAKDGAWYYTPKGTTTRPLVVGELLPGDTVHVFESQWDAFAFADVSGEHNGIVATRGASNGALVDGLIPENATVYLWPQNDAPGAKWTTDVCASVKGTVKRATIPAAYKDLNDWTRNGATHKDLLGAMMNAEAVREPPRPLIEFRSPLELRNFTPPPGLVLVGDCHVVKGSVFVIGGAPGVGKSRGSVALAVAGATQSEWFGLTTHRKFKTMVVQTENGEFRLAREFAELDCEALENFVRVCPPPPYGLCFGRDGFHEQLAAAVKAFAPDVVVFDPWNAAAREQDSREYLNTFDALKSVLPLGDDAPALCIVAHTRKPKADERTSGRALLNLLAGSYVLGSVPRTVFVMQSASDDTTDNRIVWTCCKNNDGELGARSAWERRNGLFAPVQDFDWDAFDAPEKDRRELISESDVRAVLQGRSLSPAEAAKELESQTAAHRVTCYRALKPNGRFGRHLRFEGGKITWK